MFTGLLDELDEKGKQRTVYSHHVGGPGFSLFAHNRDRQDDEFTTPDVKSGCSHPDCESEVANQRVCGHRVCPTCEPDRGDWNLQCQLCVIRTSIMNLQLHESLQETLARPLTLSDMDLDQGGGSDDDDNDDDTGGDKGAGNDEDIPLVGMESGCDLNELVARLLQVPSKGTPIVSPPSAPSQSVTNNNTNAKTNTNAKNIIQCPVPGCKKNFKPTTLSWYNKHMAAKHPDFIAQDAQDAQAAEILLSLNYSTR